MPSFVFLYYHATRAAQFLGPKTIMKLSLLVLTAGNSEGKEIPIVPLQFTIGRDPKCNLRPASAIISKRHCALLKRNGKVFVRDFDSTNGTFVNEERVHGQRELRHQDKLTIGPLIFGIRMETSAAVDQPALETPTEVGANSDDEQAAAMLLALTEAVTPAPGSSILDDQGIPIGSTVMESMPVAGAENKNGAQAEGSAGRMQQAVNAEADTSAAARSLLEKYLRRPRT
jgi:pSer/pThr/pTyr-binding forkhead associated (FHA) protein